MGGLKLPTRQEAVAGYQSHPTRDGWIEIAYDRTRVYSVGSHPTRDGWIEIVLINRRQKSTEVPSHTGWVD